MKKLLFIASLFLLINQGFSQTSMSNLPWGVVNYEIHERNDKATPVFLKKVVTFHLVIKNQYDDEIYSTYPNKPAQKDISPYQTEEAYEYDSRGYLHDILRTMAEGDSITFYIDSDQYFASIDRPRPYNIAEGSEMRFIIKVLKVQDWKSVEKAKEVFAYEQTQKELEIMRKYVADNRLLARKSSSGLWMVNVEEGIGEIPKDDDLVIVHIVGKNIQGEVVESSYNKGEPLEFPVGQGFMIYGIEKGVKLMKEGGKAIFILPSTLAYGEEGVPNIIEPNTPIVVEMELISIKSQGISISDPGSINAPLEKEITTTQTSENDLEEVNMKIDESESGKKKKNDINYEEDYQKKYNRNDYKKNKKKKRN